MTPMWVTEDQYNRGYEELVGAWDDPQAMIHNHPYKPIRYDPEMEAWLVEDPQPCSRRHE